MADSQTDGRRPGGSGGFLVPSWFQEQLVSESTMNTASIFWGFSLAFAIFSAAKASLQTYRSWRRSRRITAYIAMIWGHWAANVILGVLNWLYLWGTIRASFWLWFFILIVWVFQTQLIIQIVINRISLLMMVRRKATQLKWGVFFILLCINVAVFTIWIPARLQISHTYISINNVWDRIEKCIFLIVDLILNLYFIYLVRNRLVSNGLTKYNRLFHFNILMIAFSISMDVVLVGLMSLPNSLTYLSFQSIAYLAKLHIEMNMADLIKKVARATHVPGDELSSGIGKDKSSSNGQTNSTANRTTAHNKAQNTFLASISRGANQPYKPSHTTHIELGSNDDFSPENGDGSNGQGIHKTTVVTQTIDEGQNHSCDTSSISSSEKELRAHGV